MGFTPQQVGGMSFWQFMVCADGYGRANSTEARQMRPDEMADIEELFAGAPETVH